jgi:hypothetical protein
VNIYKILFIITAITLALVIINNQNHYSNKDLVESYSLGYKKALSIENPSEDLEISCAALWLRENDKKVDKSI